MASYSPTAYLANTLASTQGWYSNLGNTLQTASTVWNEEPNGYWPQLPAVQTITFGSSTTVVLQEFINQYYGFQTFAQSQWNTFQVYGTTVISGGTVTVGAQATPEELAVWAEDARKSAEKSEAASKRSEELLLSLLNDRQLETYHAEKMFEVFVGSKLYRLRLGHKVHEIGPDGKAKVAYCIHPEFKYKLPGCDVLVAQKLMLETDPEGFHKMANEWPVAA